MKPSILLLFLLLFVSCSKEEKQADALFNQRSEKQTGIDFANDLNPTEEMNMYVFKNYYNGGGVAVGDINNDGLQDLYFTGNEVENKLYLNKGEFQFEDITASANVACANVWSTGASFVDINQDGLLDLYVCKSGSPEVEGVRHNELFINNGDNTFTEQAKTYGLDFVGLGVHAVFLDYDKDGDLDCYLLNNSIRSVGGYDLIKDQRNTPSENGNKLLRNDGGKFTDISQVSNVYTSDIGFGLGVTVGDINQDGWEDMYVSNDYFEKDYLYINQQDGTFKEQLEDYFSEISLSSMGADFADLNNDAYPDLFVTDMLPEPLERYRTTTNFMKWKRYSLQEKQGYHRQFVRNSLQLNQSGKYFQEISRFADVAATDWSWGALVFDMDNDGRKDIFVANGIAKDLTDQDYVNFYANRDLVQKQMKKEGNSLIKTLMNAMPSERVPNYAFLNQGGAVPTMKNEAKQLGLGQPTFSNGSVYADLDNDGDLDLVVNNVNDKAGVYENHSENHFIKFDLRDKNKQLAYGAKVFVHAEAMQTQYLEVAPYRGFQSCVDTRPNFGLGNHATIDSVVIEWPNFVRSVYTDLVSDSIYQFIQPSELAQPNSTKNTVRPLFTKLTNSEMPAHFENQSNAFDDEPLLLRTRSIEGPRVSMIDVNQDGVEDVYLPGAKNIPGSWLIKQEDGSFTKEFNAVFRLSSAGEEVNSHAFDANGDGMQDLYVCYGSDETKGLQNQDVLFLQQPNGEWQKSTTKFPKFSTSVAGSNDVDGDGDLDLFIAERCIPGSFGLPVTTEIWLNDGRANFTKSEEWSKSVAYDGFATDATFFDLNADGKEELIVVGEWGSPTIYTNTGNGFEKNRLPNLSGFWNRLRLADADGDGDTDILLGNLGENTFLKADAKQPLHFYVDDFDGNGDVEQFITFQEKGKDYAYSLRNELVESVPAMKKKYLKYEDYQAATIKDMFGQSVKPNYKVTETRSGWLENTGTDWKFHAFPNEAQLFPIFAFADFEREGKTYLIAGGNYSESQPKIGSYLAGKGLLLVNEKGKDFKVISPDDSGVLFRNQVRDFKWLEEKNGKRKLIVFNNNAPIEAYELEQ